jgi:hypothetical protein
MIMRQIEAAEKIAAFTHEYNQVAEQYRPRLIPGEAIDDDVPVLFLAKDGVFNRNLKLRDRDQTIIDGRIVPGKSAHVSFTASPEAAYWMLFRRPTEPGDYLYIVQAGELKRVNVIPYSDPHNLRPLHLSLVHTSLLENPNLREIPSTGIQDLRRVLMAHKI